MQRVQEKYTDNNNNKKNWMKNAIPYTGYTGVALVSTVLQNELVMWRVPSYLKVSHIFKIAFALYLGFVRGRCKCLREQDCVEWCTHFLILLNFRRFIKRRARAVSNFASSKINFIFDGCETRLHYINTFQCEPLIPKFIEFRSAVSNKVHVINGSGQCHSDV